MKELQARAKVTQTMTRDGLVVENQATGTVENISTREAEQDYSTDAEGKAEKILERAENVKDKHNAKKKAKQAAETAESEDGLHGSAARLELTEEERADPELQTGRISTKRKQKPTSWMRPAPLCRKSASRSRKKSTMPPAARQNPPCALSSRTKVRPA